jgi:hypothetical protein
MARAHRLYSILVNHYSLIADRLMPHVGNIRTHPGFRRLWDLDVDECFSLNDVWAAQAILGRSAIPWHLVRWRDSANLVERNDDYVVCLDQTDAVTYVLSACRNSRCSPDAVQVNDDGSMDFGLGGLPFARIEPLRIAPSLDSGVLGRAEQTLLGHVPGLHGIQALHRHMTEWPGLSALALSPDAAQNFPNPATDYGTHLPHPLEWRNGAQRMLKKCGEIDPPPARIEAVGAAALGAPSWNQLIAAWHAADPTAMMPWGVFDVASEDEPYELISIQTDAIRAFPAFARAAASALSEWRAAELDVQASKRGPRFQVSRPIERVGDRFALTLLQLRQPAVVLAALRVEEVDDEGLRAEVGHAMAKGLAALQRVFGIGETPQHKQLAIDCWSELALFLAEPPWRFSLCETGDPMGSLAIEYLNKMGNRIGPLVYIARHRGCIAWVDTERAYVAFDEYNAHKPYALLRGLSKTAAAKLQASFEDPAPDKIYLTDDDRQRLDELRALPIPMQPF